MIDRSLPPCSLYCAPSPIAGVGLFAGRRIEPGEYLFTVEGDVHEGNRLDSGSEWFANCFQIDADTYLYPQTPEGRYINHSCTPNAGLQMDRDMVAIRPIDQGEEITFDYSTSMSEDGWRMDCRCGSPQCRRVVGDFHDLPPVLQLDYLNHGVVQRFIVQEIFIRASEAIRHPGLSSAEIGRLAARVISLSAALRRWQPPEVA